MIKRKLRFMTKKSNVKRSLFMNQRIVKNCFSRPLNIDEYLSVLKDTGHAPAASILFYISSQKMGDEVCFSLEL